MKKIEGNPLCSWIKWRIEKNKNAIIVINGGTGSGKTYAGITLAHKTAILFDTNFNAKDNISFNFSELLKKMQLPQNQKPGTCFVFEEVGALGGGASSREWQSKANRLFHTFMQTSRHRNQILILTCPNFAFLDKGSRELCHVQMTTQYIDYKKKACYLKPFVLQVNRTTGKIYFKYLRFKKNGLSYKLSLLEMEYPPEDIVKPYEVMKKKFTDQLNQSIIDSDEKDGKKQDGRSTKPTSKLTTREVNKLERLINIGINPIDIAKIMGISRQSVFNYKKKLAVSNNTAI